VDPPSAAGWRWHCVFVSKNWRITFRIDPAGIEIVDLDYEDYH
jgi:plasmid maintenance system killer protein